MCGAVCRALQSPAMRQRPAVEVPAERVRVGARTRSSGETRRSIRALAEKPPWLLERGGGLGAAARASVAGSSREQHRWPCPDPFATRRGRRAGASQGGCGASSQRARRRGGAGSWRLARPAAMRPRRRVGGASRRPSAGPAPHRGATRGPPGADGRARSRRRTARPAVPRACRLRPPAGVLGGERAGPAGR